MIETVAASTDIGLVSVFEKDDMFLNRIEILPAHQNREIGTFLIRRIITQSENENKSVFLQVLKSNGRAKALYERFGFSVCGKTPTHYQVYSTVVVVPGIPAYEFLRDSKTG